MKWWLFMLCCLLLMALSFSGVYLLAISPGETVDDNEPAEYLIGMSQANLIEPWRVTMNLEFAQAAAAHDCLRVIYTDAAQDTQRQISDVNMLMGYGIDLLVISPNDSEALRPVLAQVYQEIPVIVLDRAVSGEDYTLFIGPNNDRIGYLAGLQVIQMLGEAGGRVVEILGTEDSPPVAARSEGFNRAIADYPQIVIDQHLVADWQQDRAEDRFKEYAVTCKQMADVVVAQSDAMAYGAWIAADKLRVEGVRFLGMDGLSGGIDLVARGILDATVYCPTGARQAVDYILRILDGEQFSNKQVILEPQLILPAA